MRRRRLEAAPADVDGIERARVGDRVERVGVQHEQIRGRTVPEARTILAFTARDAARDMEKVLNSAVANAEANHGLIGDEMLVSAAFVGAGPTLKRWRARARGRVARIRKRTCHITIKLSPLDGSAVPAPLPRVAPVAPGAAPEPGGKPKRAARKKPEVPVTTEPPEAPEDKPKTRPKRAQKPKAAAPEGTEAKPKRNRSAKPKAEEKTEDEPETTRPEKDEEA